MKLVRVNNMNQNSARLENGSKVAIVGGGPAGSLFALYLLRYAGEKGIRPEVTIYQQRSFSALGPKGCKGCAGILSASLLKNLGELGLSLPGEVIQSKIAHYIVHSPYTSISISKPEKEIEVASVNRGGGPRISHGESHLGFDGWLLGQAQERGVKVESQAVCRIHLGHEAVIEVAGGKLNYDLVVLASGVNAKPVQIMGHRYIPPKTRIMAQDELYAGAAQVEARLGNTAHIFLIPGSDLIFGSLVPKGPFINVSVLSRGKNPVSVAHFLSYDVVRRVLPEHYEYCCGCRPKTVVSSAQNYYGDRFVAVGDAAASRLYKDGIGSSLLTAREAARTAVFHGISRQSFETHYRPFIRAIDRDNRWGRLLFSVHSKTKDSRAFLLAQHRLIGDEQDNSRALQPFTKITWGMFTGSYSYRSMARMALAPASLVRLFSAFWRQAFGHLSRNGVAYPRRLHVGGKKILILGSGFGGTYSLRHLVRSLNRNENVETTMVSDENFFLFAPLLHEVATGSIETRHIAYPIRRLHWRDRFNFIQASVQKIDLDQRKVATTAGTLDFDYLVLALGSTTDMSDLNSAADHVFTLKTLRDSVLIRNHIISLFEQASIEKDAERQRGLLTFVVCGGGYKGVQLISELRNFVFGSLIKFHKTIDPHNIRIILVEHERQIAGELHKKIRAYATKHLEQAGIEIKLGSRVTHVWEDKVEINGAEVIPTRAVIWVTGVVASPQIADLGVEKDSSGRVMVNDYLEVPRMPGVYAVGDCAHFKDHLSGRPIPPRAHTAVRQAKVVAHNILAEIRGKEKKPYRYSNNAEILSLGASKAAFRYGGLRLYGFPARLIWLAAYSTLVTGTYNRIRIVGDWFLSLIFGRDTTFLKLNYLDSSREDSARNR